MARPRMTSKDFWSSMDRSGGPDACWNWQKGKFNRGYGCVHWDGTAKKAHRVAYFLHNGAYPKGFACHTCDNPSCCNPSHIYDGTPLSNMRDKVDRGRQPRGSEHGRAKLAEADVVEIKKARREGETLVSIAERYGVTYSTVARAVKGECWAHVEAAR